MLLGTCIGGDLRVCMRDNFPQAGHRNTMRAMYEAETFSSNTDWQEGQVYEIPPLPLIPGMPDISNTVVVLGSGKSTCSNF
ncbi:MAG: hypothetical protein KGK44_06960 [Gammaproteobacteria bacterium]|nr:hypothetical protein [Gammaproteobacteria bacterium]